MLASERVKVTQQGANAYCQFNKRTGKVERINLPIIPNNPSEEFMAALQGYVDHEVAHALFTKAKGGLAPDVDAKTLKSSERILHTVTNAVEDVRIEAAMCKRYPGAAQNLSSTLRFVLDNFIQPKLDELGPIDLTDDRQVNLARSIAFISYLRAKGGQPGAIDHIKAAGLEALFEPFDQAMPDLSRRLAALKSTNDAANLAAYIIEKIMQDVPEAKKDEAGEGDSEEAEGSDGSDESDSDSGKSGENEDSKSEDDSEGGSEDESEEPSDNEEPEDKPSKGKKQEQEESEEDSEGEGETEDDSEDETETEAGSGSGEEDESAEDESEGASGDSDTGEEGEDADDGEPQESSGESSSYNGKDKLDPDQIEDMDTMLSKKLGEAMKGTFGDERQVDFTRDWDRIEPFEEDKDVDVSKLAGHVQAMAGPLQNHLQRIIVARSQAYSVGGFRSGRLNGSALHRLSAGDDRIFRRKHVDITNKVAVSLVVDLSGSMQDTARGSTFNKVEVAMIAAWSFSQVLDRLGISHEVSGFTTSQFPSNISWGALREDWEQMAVKTGVPYNNIRKMPIWIPIFKSFAERFTNVTKKRLATQFTHQSHMSANDDATALIYASERLRARPEERKVMIVFSDGQPSEQGVSHDVLQQSTKAAVEAMPAMGIEAVGVGIMSEEVRHFYPKWLLVNSPEDLPRKAMIELEGLLSHRAKAA
jgi:cobalamin biosynthesis protein CobT